MKAALIPPIPELHRFGSGSFHLLLSHLMGDPRYFKHYKAQREHGAYLVLDNSAHESGIGERAGVLLDQALALKAQEIVVPDCLDDAEGTIESGLSAIEHWFEGERREEARELNPALMYVPQGATKDDWVTCLSELIRLQMYAARKLQARQDFVIGVSKDYEVWDGGLEALLTQYLVPLRENAARRGIKISVHLLGWGRDLWKLDELRRQFPWIRSTDSAKPFVYALRNITLNHDHSEPPKYPGRGKTYFVRNMNERQRVIARTNVRVFKQLAGDNV